MTKNELIEELQKIEGNPIISIGINKSWGKLSLPVSGITPLYNHDGHKVESSPSIFELNCDDNNPMTEEQLAEFNRDRLIRKYGPLSICSIDERYWAVNGPWFEKGYQEKIKRLEAEIAKLKNKG